MSPKKELNNQIIKFAQENPQYLVANAANVEFLSKKYGVTQDRVVHQLRKAREGNSDYVKSRTKEKPVVEKGDGTDFNPDPDIQEPVKIEPEPTLPIHDLKLRRVSAELAETKRKYNILLGDFEGLQGSYDDLLEISNTPVNPHPIITGDPDIKGEATVLAIFSDHHYAEYVDPRLVMGMNETSLPIMTKRVDTLTRNLIRLVNKERKDVNIDNLVLALLGDFMNSFLHEHDIQQNFLAPMEELVFARDQLISSIQYILDNGNFKKITVVCMRGNHPRTTFKMSSSTDYKMNYEAVLYNMLDKYFSPDPRIEFHIPQSEIGYVTVYDKTIRYFHGHEIKYNGGVGGITISLNKQLLRWDQNKKADLNIFGHFHEQSKPTKNSLLNGSLVGFNSYAQSLGFAYERPMQTFQLIDKELGFTVYAPIFCD